MRLQTKILQPWPVNGVKLPFSPKWENSGEFFYLPRGLRNILFRKDGFDVTRNMGMGGSNDQRCVFCCNADFVFFILQEGPGPSTSKKREKLETFSVEQLDSNDLEERKNEYDLGGWERLKIVSGKAVNWIRIYAVTQDEKNNQLCWQKKPLQTHRFLQANEPVYFKLDIPEGIPNLGVRFEREDYIQGCFFAGYDGRFGGMYPVEYQLHNTIKSMVYYMLK